MYPKHKPPLQIAMEFCCILSKIFLQKKYNKVECYYKRNKLLSREGGFVFHNAKPMKMSKEDYFNALANNDTYDIKKSTKDKLIKLDAMELTELKMCILSTGKCVEQESML